MYNFNNTLKIYKDSNRGAFARFMIDLLQSIYEPLNRWTKIETEACKTYRAGVVTYIDDEILWSPLNKVDAHVFVLGLILDKLEESGLEPVKNGKIDMDVLFEAGWIRPRGRRQTPGRPVTWGTTEGFLDQFAMESIDDLPGIDELKAAGLIDKRPAIQTLSTRANITSINNPDELEELPEKNLMNETPLDPDDGEDLASLVTE